MDVHLIELDTVVKPSRREFESWSKKLYNRVVYSLLIIVLLYLLLLFLIDLSTKSFRRFTFFQTLRYIRIIYSRQHEPIATA